MGGIAALLLIGLGIWLISRRRRTRSRRVVAPPQGIVLTRLNMDSTETRSVISEDIKAPVSDFSQDVKVPQA